MTTFWKVNIPMWGLVQTTWTTFWAILTTSPCYVLWSFEQPPFPFRYLTTWFVPCPWPCYVIFMTSDTLGSDVWWISDWITILYLEKLVLKSYCEVFSRALKRFFSLVISLGAWTFYLLEMGLPFQPKSLVTWVSFSDFSNVCGKSKVRKMEETTAGNARS